MRGTLIIIFTSIILFSCNREGKQTKPGQGSDTASSKNYSKPTFDDPFFKEDHFNYADNIQGDSTKERYTAKTTIIEYGYRYFLRNCDITKRNDSLLLKFNDDPFSASLVQLDINKVHDQFICRYYQTFSFTDNTDSSFKPPVFKVIDQHIVLDKASYEKGDSLKGKFVIKVSAVHSRDEQFTDTIHIYGLVKTIVE